MSFNIFFIKINFQQESFLVFNILFELIKKTSSIKNSISK